MRKSKKLKEFEKQEENAFKQLVNTFVGSQFYLFQEYLTARHLKEMEQYDSVLGIK